MWKYAWTAEELETNLNKPTEAQQEIDHKTAQVLQLLVLAGDLLDEVGLEVEANWVTNVLEGYADPAVRGLDSDHILDNLKETGIPLNLEVEVGE
jgi:hypothetical protein